VKEGDSAVSPVVGVMLMLVVTTSSPRWCPALPAARPQDGVWGVPTLAMDVTSTNLENST